MVFTVFGIQPLYAYQERLALLIGLESYEKGDGKAIFRDLPFSNDLEALRLGLLGAGFSEIEVITDSIYPPDPEAYRLIGKKNSPVGKSEFENEIKSYLRSLDDKQNAFLLVYFTGHGGVFTTRVGLDVVKNRFIAFPNSKYDDSSTFASVREILDTMASFAPGVDKMLVVDVCADIIGEEYRPYASIRGGENLPGRLYSSKVGEKSYFDRRIERPFLSGKKEEEKGISVFTHYFVESLKYADLDLYDEQADGKIDSGEIASYVQTKVPKHIGFQKQKKRTSSTNKYNQHPIDLMPKKMVLSDTFSARGVNETLKEFESRVEGFRRANYGGS